MVYIKNLIKAFSGNNDGTSAIEYALLFPIFAILALACIEFGAYFAKDEITSHAVSQLANVIQQNPTLTQSQWNTLVKQAGLGFIPFGQNGNFICAQSYVNPPSTPLTCNSNSFNISPPNGIPQGQIYYVQIGASLKQGNVTPLGNLLPIVKKIKIAQSSGIIQVGNLTPTGTCNGPGMQLQFNGTSFSCVPGPPPCQPGQVLQWTGKVYQCKDISPPGCSQPWQRLAYSNGAYTCINVSYVMAGGIANPASSNGMPLGNSYWDQDTSYTTWLGSTGGTTHQRFTLCERGIPFTVPANMPAGQILMQGNLLYFGAGGGWNHWTISFINTKVPTPPKSGNASFDICESNGGNWILDTDNPTIGAEHVSWSAIYVPNSAR